MFYHQFIFDAPQKEPIKKDIKGLIYITVDTIRSKNHKIKIRSKWCGGLEVLPAING